MGKKYELLKMLEEIKEDDKGGKTASVHVSQDDIEKLITQKKKKRKRMDIDGDENKS